MSEMDKYWQILGLNPGASETEIKQAYRDIVNVWHPDRFSDSRLKEKANRKLKEINFAYEKLKSYIAGNSRRYASSEGNFAKSQAPPHEAPPKSEREKTTTARSESHGGLQPPPEQAFGQSTVKLFYAGFWSRLVASFIDSLLLVLGGLVLTLPFLIAKGMSNVRSEPFWIIFDFILSWLIGWLYFTLLESSHKQATLGKMAVGLIVTDLDGNPISFGRANGRWWGKIISSLILGIGYIMAGFTQKKQGLHDIMADTLVVKKYGKVNPWAIWITVIFVVLPTMFLVGFISGSTIAILIGKKAETARVHEKPEMAPQEAPLPEKPQVVPWEAPIPLPTSSSAEVASQIQTLKEIVEKDPKNLPAWVELGNLYFDSDQPKEAIEAYRHYLAVKPENPDVRTDLGIMYRKLGQFDKTLEEFRKAALSDPKHINSRYNIGLVLLHDKQDIGGAIKAWEEYLRVDPNSERAQRIRAQIEKMKTAVAK